MISSDVVIITKTELEEIKNKAFLRGVERGRFEEISDRNSKALGNAGHSEATENTGAASPDAAVRLANTYVRDAERERCAKIADAVAADAQEQIDRNNEYKARTGSTDESCNDLCRHKKHAAEWIAADIRRAPA